MLSPPLIIILGKSLTFGVYRTLRFWGDSSLLLGYWVGMFWAVAFNSQPAKSEGQALNQRAQRVTQPESGANDSTRERSE